MILPENLAQAAWAHSHREGAMRFPLSFRIIALEDICLL
jgi:hypothetical protein